MRPVPAICLAGPTGAGKTALALDLADDLGCEIINADSRQAYADFPIVTAQPDASELARAPHHLYAFLRTEERLDAASWAALALRKAEEAAGRGRLPLIVGGSGFYFQALLTPLAEIPPAPPEIKDHCAALIKSRGAFAMHAELKKIDPEWAAKIHPNDSQRVQRGLEVFRATGKTLTYWHKKTAPEAALQGPLFALLPSLDELAPRLASRAAAMREAGALDEIARAWKRCPDASKPGWSGIGCREGLDYLMGRIDRTEWEKKWLAATRAYAKRQLTWLRGRKNAVPASGAGFILSRPETLAAARAARGF